MITSTDIANILYKDCQVFGLNVFQNGNIPDGEIENERITIHTKQQSIEPYWNKGFVEVNFCVPDMNGKANLIRLGELERDAVYLLEDVGEHDGSHYRYSVYSHGVEEDVPMRCHYINVRLLFEVLNVK